MAFVFFILVTLFAIAVVLVVSASGGGDVCGGMERRQSRHVGPNGGVYRINARGQRVYLRADGTNKRSGYYFNR